MPNIHLEDDICWMKKTLDEKHPYSPTHHLTWGVYSVPSVEGV